MTVVNMTETAIRQEERVKCIITYCLTKVVFSLQETFVFTPGYGSCCKGLMNSRSKSFCLDGTSKNEAGGGRGEKGVLRRRVMTLFL